MRALLAEEPQIELVGEGYNGEQALEVTKRLRPDILLLDLGPASITVSRCFTVSTR